MPEYLGNFSAAPPWHSVLMTCDACDVSWTGCWDNFECPRCGSGELPWMEPTATTQDTPAASTTTPSQEQGAMRRYYDETIGETALFISSLALMAWGPDVVVAVIRSLT